jgi:hypothetical protein
VESRVSSNQEVNAADIPTAPIPVLRVVPAMLELPHLRPVEDLEAETA